MNKHSHDKVVFKPYVMGQPSLLPADLEELIPEGHLVRTVHAAIEQLDLQVLYQQYPGGGTSSYHPKMMLKVLIYGYVERLYSSRKIAKALRENVNFMWLAGQNRPDFRTLNRFRGEMMPAVIGEVFASVLELLIEQGHVKLEDYFIDGSKLEANARRHTAVWAKNTRRYKAQVRGKIEELLEEIEQENQAEQDAYGDQDLPEVGETAEMDSQRLQEKIEQLNERLRQKPTDKNLQKAVRQLEKDYLPRLEKYEQQEKKLAGRNSYSKTDEEATFMRLKADQRNPHAWPKPAYNLQLGTENQFIVGFSVHQHSNDGICLIPHLDAVEHQLGRLPHNWIGDGAYGTEENLAYAEHKQGQAFLKYRHFYRQEIAPSPADRFRVEHFTYDPERDRFTCPQGRRLLFERLAVRVTQTGYRVESRRYVCDDCRGCPVKQQCTRGAGPREINVSWNFQRLKATARQLLTSATGVKLRARRGWEVESVFGQIKFNRQFQRFMLRGLQKVRTELGLLALAHNFIKLAAV